MVTSYSLDISKVVPTIHYYVVPNIPLSKNPEKCYSKLGKFQKRRENLKNLEILKFPENYYIDVLFFRFHQTDINKDFFVNFLLLKKGKRHYQRYYRQTRTHRVYTLKSISCVWNLALIIDFALIQEQQNISVTLGERNTSFFLVKRKMAEELNCKIIENKDSEVLK